MIARSAQTHHKHQLVARKAGGSSIGERIGTQQTAGAVEVRRRSNNPAKQRFSVRRKKRNGKEQARGTEKSKHGGQKRGGQRERRTTESEGGETGLGKQGERVRGHKFMAKG